MPAPADAVEPGRRDAPGQGATLHAADPRGNGAVAAVPTGEDGHRLLGRQDPVAVAPPEVDGAARVGDEGVGRAVDEQEAQGRPRGAVLRLGRRQHHRHRRDGA